MATNGMSRERLQQQGRETQEKLRARGTRNRLSPEEARRGGLTRGAQLRGKSEYFRELGRKGAERQREMRQERLLAASGAASGTPEATPGSRHS